MNQSEKIKATLERLNNIESHENPDLMALRNLNVPRSKIALKNGPKYHVLDIKRFAIIAADKYVEVICMEERILVEAFGASLVVDHSNLCVSIVLLLLTSIS